MNDPKQFPAEPFPGPASERPSSIERAMRAFDRQEFVPPSAPGDMLPNVLNPSAYPAAGAPMPGGQMPGGQMPGGWPAPGAAGGQMPPPFGAGAQFSGVGPGMGQPGYPGQNPPGFPGGQGPAYGQNAQPGAPFPPQAAGQGGIVSTPGFPGHNAGQANPSLGNSAQGGGFRPDPSAAYAGAGQPRQNAPYPGQPQPGHYQPGPAPFGGPNPAPPLNGQPGATARQNFAPAAPHTQAAPYAAGPQGFAPAPSHAAAPPHASAPQGAPHAAKRPAVLPQGYYPIDRRRLAEQGMLGTEASTAGQVEEFRIVKRQLIEQADDMRRRGGGGAAQRIMVCSAHAGEGKTFCAVNLAMSISAEKESEVLLVDFDLARASVLQLLGLPPGPGLMEALVDPSIDVRKCVMQTDIPGLSVLPGGRPTNSDTEYLAHSRAATVLDQLTEDAPQRIVLFDSPPALAASIPAELAKLVGQVVMVVMADVTPSGAIQDAASLLAGCPNVQLLLNSVQFSPNGRRFGSYHGYRG